MSEETNPKPKEDKPKEMIVTVDSKEMERLTKEKLELEAKAKELEEKLKTTGEGKKELEDELARVKEEVEDYRNKFEIIAEQELAKKKTALIEKAKAMNLGDERIKELESKITDLETLKLHQYTVDVLEDAMKKGEEAHKKLLEEEKKKHEEELAKIKTTGPAPAGQAPLAGQSAPKGYKQQQFDSFEAMIKDLREREKSADIEVAAEAKAILDEFFRKWASAVKKQAGRVIVEPKEQPSIKEITKPKEATQAEKKLKGE
jgi:hypothetical protein